ncbi:lysophospholipid acyltransferase family protein [Psychromicrobium lacuslunae]|uniref:Glycerol acyltransferase n=1 Tax=Psychromicrobium lacuslunae TaxID=1618207 RepID=A0A0D4BVY1_9MICC|nr:lysophospholipid acyltransferase family protein [Psychromicrobium lacuslunae]AJT40484.1 glycerol acyltransferase [Psychromicrobium lacuslunae]
MAWRPAPNNTFYRFIVGTGLFLRWLLQLDVRINGSEHLPTPDPIVGKARKPVPGKGAVIAITHFGYLDFAVASLVMWKHGKVQMRYLIHKGAAEHWLAGPAISAAGHVVVDRTAGADAYQQAVQKLREGEYIAILPEAGVSRSFTVRECKTGAARMAAEAGVPIVPISIWGAHRLMTRGHRFNFLRSWKAPIQVQIGEQLRFSSTDDAVTSTETLRSALQQGIDQASASFPLQAEAGAWWVPAAQGGGAMTLEEQRSADQQDRIRRGQN